MFYMKFNSGSFDSQPIYNNKNRKQKFAIV